MLIYTRIVVYTPPYGNWIPGPVVCHIVQKSINKPALFCCLITLVGEVSVLHYALPLAPVKVPQLKLPLSANRGQFPCPLSVIPLMGKMQNRDLISGLG